MLRGTSRRSARGARCLVAVAVSLCLPASALGSSSVEIVSGPPAWTNATGASFGLTSDEPGALECRLDGQSDPGARWRPCADGYTIPGPLPEGRHVLEARTGGGPAQDSWTWRVDVTAPTSPTIYEPEGLWHTERVVSTSWGAHDAYSGVGAYDVVYDVWASNGAAAAGVKWLQGSTATGAAFIARSGRTYCLRVGVRDQAGNRAPGLSPRRCFARPLDDAALDRRGPWKRPRGADGYLGGTYIEATRAGAFARTVVSAKRLLLLATRCPGCGSLEVRWRGRVVRTVDLRSPRRKKSARIPLVTLPAIERGTVRFDVTSTNRRVRIDGVGASAR